jgi:hypothetical protein
MYAINRAKTAGLGASPGQPRGRGDGARGRAGHVPTSGRRATEPAALRLSIRSRDRMRKNSWPGLESDVVRDSDGAEFTPRQTGEPRLKKCSRSVIPDVVDFGNVTALDLSKRSSARGSPHVNVPTVTASLISDLGLGVLPSRSR